MVNIGDSGGSLADHLKTTTKMPLNFISWNILKNLIAYLGISLHQNNTEICKYSEQKLIFQLGTLGFHGINEIILSLSF